MATVFKTFLNNDIKSTRTLLHEAIPLTGALASGTYGGDTIALGSETNIKNYAHGMFQSVYDYPYLSSSANHIFDLTVGYSTQSPLSKSTHNVVGGAVQQAKKNNIYNQMAQVLVGHDITGGILRFDPISPSTPDNGSTSTKMDECIFINFARLLGKDEIKKGSFSMTLGTGSFLNPFVMGAVTTYDTTIKLVDTGAESDYRVNSPAGEYALLTSSGDGGRHATGVATGSVGLIFYQAGVVVLSGSILVSSSAGGLLGHHRLGFGGPIATYGGQEDTNWPAVVTGSAISASCNFLRHRIKDISFNNTTELNSTIHFCRVNHNDFNYSSNPTYLSESKIRVKNNTLDAPVSYITTVGLYSADNELLAVAKLSEPLKKDPTNEMTIRVRLDY